jgi:dTDP-L-rhamnose 4-epimerase
MELHPTDATAIYARSKLLGERVALQLGDAWGIEVVALRYALTYGPRQSRSNPYTGICAIFANRVRNGLPPIVFEDGKQTRDFTYVEDVARANVIAGTSEEIIGWPQNTGTLSEPEITGGRVLNVGTGISTSVLGFAFAICEALDMGIDPELSGEYRPDDARHVITDPTLIESLGWKPQILVDEGVRRYLEWLEDQPPVTDVTEGAYALMRGEGVIV